MTTMTEQINDTERTEAPSTQPGANQSAPARLWKTNKYRVVTVVSLIALLCIWEYFGRQMNPIFASYPTAISVEFWNQVTDGTLPEALLDSLRPLAFGYLLAALVGIPVGLLVGRYRIVDASIGIFITGGYSMPMVAFIPLFILWFGLGFSVKVAVVVVMTIFPIIISTWAGVSAVPKSMIEVAKSFVASEATIMRKVILPATVPHIMTGLRLGIGRAVIGIVIAEFFTAIGGLGGLIIRAGQRFDTASLFVPIVVLMILGIGLTRIVGWLEGKVAPWHASVSGGRDQN